MSNAPDMQTTATATVKLARKMDGKTYVAELDGVCERYGFERDFLDADKIDMARSGKTGVLTWELGAGVYETQERRTRGYLIVEGGVAREVSLAEATAAVSPSEDA